MKQKPVIILGAGEHGQVVANILTLNGYTKISFLDDNKQNPEIIGPLSKLEDYISDYEIFISFGNNELRRKWYNNLKTRGKNLINAIHPNARLENSIKLGENVMIGANTYININTIIGNNVIINNSCNIDHDNIIEDHVQIAPGVVTGGKVKIKKCTFIGIGSTIIDHLTLESHNIIGGGAVVVDDLKEQNSLYIGIPAKKYKNTIN